MYRIVLDKPQAEARLVPPIDDERSKQHVVAQTEIEILGNTIFSNGIVIALTEPADDTRNRLRARQLCNDGIEGSSVFFSH